MRKIFKVMVGLAALAFLFSLTVATAQAGINFGVKGGISLANISSVPETFAGYKWETKRGLAGGAFLEIGLPGPFSLQPEVLYVQKGAKISVAEGEVVGTFKANLDYIEIPLLLKFNLFSGGLTVPSIYAGPFYGFNTKAEFVFSSPGYPDQKEDIKDDIKDSEYGLTFGLGLTQKLGIVKITLDARYDLGLSNNVEPTVVEPSSIKTRTWLFMIGIAF